MPEIISEGEEGACCFETEAGNILPGLPPSFYTFFMVVKHTHNSYLEDLSKSSPTRPT